MDIYASDEEKGEAIKRWWLEHGRAIGIACALAVMVGFGGRYWLEQQRSLAENASLTYQQVLQALQANDRGIADELTQQLLSEFSSTPYAIFAALDMATEANKNGDTEAAMIYLQWVSDNATLAGHHEIAWLRQAKLLVDQEKFDQALALIDQAKSASFSSLFAELRGDIAVALAKQEDARQAYKNAMNSLTQGDPRQILLEIKLADLAVEEDE